jgi:hypothetical protein
MLLAPAATPLDALDPAETTCILNSGDNGIRRRKDRTQGMIDADGGHLMSKSGIFSEGRSERRPRPKPGAVEEPARSIPIFPRLRRARGERPAWPPVQA